MAKARKRSRKGLAKKATELAQTLARLTETDENGWGFCKSCGQPVHYKEANGGHFQPKGINYNGTCIDGRNIHLQCVECNLYRQGNPAGYSRWMYEELGAEVVDDIKLKSKQVRLTAEDFEEFIERVAPIVRKLKNDKAFML